MNQHHIHHQIDGHTLMLALLAIVSLVWLLTLREGGFRSVFLWPTLRFLP